MRSLRVACLNQFRRLRAPTVALAAVVIYAGSACGAAAAITVGPELPTNKPSFGGFVNCGPACTSVNTSLAGEPGNLTSPVDGTIVAWRMNRPEPGGVYRLRVLTPEGPSTYKATATSATVGQSVTRTLETFPTDLPIKAGQTIGLDLEFGALGTYTGSSERHEGFAVEGQSQAFGNSTALAGEYNAVVLQPPTVTAVTPPAGPTGSTVVIEGSNLDPEYVESVTFGATSAPFVGSSDSQISVTVPPGSGSVPVTVTTGAGDATAPEEFTYREPPPTPPTPPSPPTTPSDQTTPPAAVTAPNSSAPPAGGWFGIRKIRQDLSKGTVGLAVDFTGSGEVSLTGKGVKAAFTKVGGGPSDLPIVPTGGLKAKLARTGTAKATVTVSFRTAGNVWTKTKTISLRLAS